MTPLEKKLKRYKGRLGNVQTKIDREMTNVLKRNRLFLAELNRSQLLEGNNEEGQPIGNTNPYRSVGYSNYKNELNPLPGKGNPDLRLSGDYWDSIDATIKNKEIEMIAKDEKAPQLAHYRGIGIAPFNYPEISELLRRLVKIEI